MPNLIDKFPQGASSNVGDSVDAGLPNISGRIDVMLSQATPGQMYSMPVSPYTGALGFDREATALSQITFTDLASATQKTGIRLNASNSSSVYGNSTTVQPPAVKLLPCIKAYSDVDNLGSLDVAQLENYVQNNCVHLTGDETVSGIKTFTNALLSNVGFHIKKSGFIKGSTPSDTQYLTVRFCDSTGIEFKNALGQLETAVGSNGLTQVNIRAIKNEANSTESANIFLGIDENNIKYAIAPSTSNTRTNPTDILTRDWIPQDTRIVHTTGDENINGIKKFTYIVGSLGTSPSYILSSTCPSKGTAPSGSNKHGYISYNANSKFDLASTTDRICGIEFALSTGKTTSIVSKVYNWTAGSTDEAGTVLECVTSSGTYNLRPTATSKVSCGSINYRWLHLYTNDSAINGSDERIKDTISNVPDDVLDAWENVNFVQFQMKEAIKEKGPSARFHNGLIAQSIDKAFRDQGLDASKYGLFCYDEWEATPEEKDEEGNIVQQSQEAGNLYSLRYEEALCMEAAYQRRRADRAEARIANLEEEISSLKLQFSQLINSLK